LSISYSTSDLGTTTLEAALKDEDASQFVFWSFERDTTGLGLTTSYVRGDNPGIISGRTITGSNNNWYAEAHLQAQVKFHGAGENGGNLTDVFRIYEQDVFLENEVTNSYTWRFADRGTIADDVAVSTSAASPTDAS